MRACCATAELQIKCSVNCELAAGGHTSRAVKAPVKGVVGALHLDGMAESWIGNLGWSPQESLL
jgi:hypothetical protein